MGNDAVADGFAQLVSDAVCRNTGDDLGHLQFGIGRLHIGFDFVFILGIAAGSGTLGGGHVQHAACDQVVLSDGVFCGEGSCLAGNQGFNLPCIAGQFVLNLHIACGQVAGIAHHDAIGNHFAQLIGFAVGGRAGDGLHQLDFRVGGLGFGLNLIFIGNGGVPGIGAAATGGDHIQHAACHQVILGDHVAGGECLGSAAAQGLDEPLITGKLIFNLNVGQAQVAGILHHDLIGDFLAGRIAFSLCGGIGDGFGNLDGGGCILSGIAYGIAAGNGRAVGGGARGSGDIHHPACNHFILKYRVLCIEAAACAGSKGFDGPVISGQRIGDGDIIQGQVAFVLHQDLIADDFVHGIILAVRGGAYGDLIHADCGIGIFGFNDFDILFIAGGGHIAYAAIEDILLQHHIAGGEAAGSARSEGGNAPAVAGQRIFNRDVVLGYVAGVGNDDLVADGFAQLVGLAVGGAADCGLDHAQGFIHSIGEVGHSGGFAHGGGHVHNPACADILFLHGVAAGESFAIADFQADGLSQADQTVHNLNCIQLHVAGVAHGDLVSDHFAQGVGAAGCGFGGGHLGQGHFRIGIFDLHNHFALFTAGGGDVLYVACQDVLLLHGVAAGEGFAIADVQQGDGFIEADHGVHNQDVLQFHIAGVLYHDLEIDLLAQGKGTAVGMQVGNGLGDGQVADFRFSGNNNRVGRRAVCLCGVFHLACVHIRLLDHIAAVEYLAFACSQGDLFIQADLFIHHVYFLSNVALVGNGDLVSDGFAQAVCGVLGLAGFFLLYRQAVICLDGVGGSIIRAGNLFIIGCGAFSGNYILYDAFLHIRFSYLVAGGEVLGCAAAQGFDEPLFAGEAVHNINVGQAQVAAVLHQDAVGDFLAHCIAAAVGGFIGDGLGDLNGGGCFGSNVSNSIAAGNGRAVGGGACGGNHVLYAACHQVILGDGVAGGEVLGCAAAQGFDEPLIVGKLIFNLDVGQAQVAAVLHQDAVGDFLAHCIAAAVSGFVGDGLGDLDGGGCFGSGIAYGIAVLHFIAFGVSALGSGGIFHLACNHFILKHGMSGSEDAACAGRHGADGPFISGQGIVCGHIGQGDVAGVLYGDLVGDHFACIVAHAVCGSAGGDLIHEDESCCGFGGNLNLALNSTHGGHIQHRALENILFQHHIAGGEACALAGGKGIDFPGIAGQRILNGQVGAGDVAVVGNGDQVGYALTLGIGLAVCGSAGNGLGDCQGFNLLLSGIFNRGSLAIGRCSVGYGTIRIHRAQIILGNGVGYGVFFLRTDLQGDGFLQTHQFIHNQNIFSRHIALVFNHDQVVDGFAQGKGRFVCIGGDFGDGYLALGCGNNCLCRCGFFRIVDGGYNRVHNRVVLALDILLGDGIFAGELDRAIDGQVHAAVQANQGINHLQAVQGHVAGVGDGDLEFDHFAQGKGLAIGRLVGNCLGDGPIGVLALGVDGFGIAFAEFGFTVNCCRSGGIYHAANQDILCGYAVAAGEYFHTLRAQGDGAVQADQFILNRYIAQGHVAGVLYGDAVSNQFAQGVGIALGRSAGDGLFNGQRGLCALGGNLYRVGRNRLGGGGGLLGGGNVYNLVCRNIRFRYHIAAGEHGACACGQGNHFVQADLSIHHVQVRQLHVAGVGNGHLVGDGFAQLVGCAVGGRAGCFLEDAYAGIGGIGVNGNAGFLGFVVTAYSNHIHHGTLGDIRLGDGVFHIEGSHIAVDCPCGGLGRQGFNGFLQAHQRIHNLHIFQGLVAGVYNGDAEGDLLAQLVGFAVCRSAGDSLAHGEVVLGCLSFNGFRIALSTNESGVHNLAGCDVFFGNCIAAGEDFGFAHIQVGGGVQIDQIIIHRQIGEGLVAGVYNGDLVLNGIAQLVGFKIPILNRLIHGVAGYGCHGFGLCAGGYGFMAFQGGNNGVYNLARCDIRAGDAVEQAALDILLFTHAQADGALQADQFILNHQAVDGLVAGVLYNDLVGDGFVQAKLLASRRIGDALFDGPAGNRLHHGIAYGSAAGNILALMVLAGGNNGVGNGAAGKLQVACLHPVGCGEAAAAAGNQLDDVPAVAGQCIVYNHIGQIHIAGVGHHDAVGDGFAQAVVCAVLGLAGGFLGDGDCGSGRFHAYLSAVGLHVFAVGGGNGIHQLAVVLCCGKDIGSSYGVIHSVHMVLAHSQIDAVVQADHSVHNPDAGKVHIAGIGDGDLVADGFAQLVAFGFADDLLFNLMPGIGIFTGGRFSAVAHFGDIGVIGGGNVHNLACRNIRLGDGVAAGDGAGGCARCQVDGLADIQQGVGDHQILGVAAAGVGNGDFVGDGFAFHIELAVCGRAGDDLFDGDHGQLAGVGNGDLCGVILGVGSGDRHRCSGIRHIIFAGNVLLKDDIGAFAQLRHGSAGPGAVGILGEIVYQQGSGGIAALLLRHESEAAAVGIEALVHHMLGQLQPAHGIICDGHFHIVAGHLAAHDIGVRLLAFDFGGYNQVVSILMQGAHFIGGYGIAVFIHIVHGYGVGPVGVIDIQHIAAAQFGGGAFAANLPFMAVVGIGLADAIHIICVGQHIACFQFALFIAEEQALHVHGVILAAAFGNIVVIYAQAQVILMQANHYGYGAQHIPAAAGAVIAVRHILGCAVYVVGLLAQPHHFRIGNQVAVCAADDGVGGSFALGIGDGYIQAVQVHGAELGGGGGNLAGVVAVGAVCALANAEGGLDLGVNLDHAQQVAILSDHAHRDGGVQALVFAGVLAVGVYFGLVHGVDNHIVPFAGGSIVGEAAQIIIIQGNCIAAGGIGGAGAAHLPEAEIAPLSVGAFLGGVISAQVFGVNIHIRRQGYGGIVQGGLGGQGYGCGGVVCGESVILVYAREGCQHHIVGSRLKVGAQGNILSNGLPEIVGIAQGMIVVIVPVNEPGNHVLAFLGRFRIGRAFHNVAVVHHHAPGGGICAVLMHHEGDLMLQDGVIRHQDHILIDIGKNAGIQGSGIILQVLEAVEGIAFHSHPGGGGQGVFIAGSHGGSGDQYAAHIKQAYGVVFIGSLGGNVYGDILFFAFGHSVHVVGEGEAHGGGSAVHAIGQVAAGDYDFAAVAHPQGQRHAGIGGFNGEGPVIGDGGDQGIDIEFFFLYNVHHGGLHFQLEGMHMHHHAGPYAVGRRCGDGYGAGIIAGGYNAVFHVGHGGVGGGPGDGLIGGVIGGNESGKVQHFAAGFQAEFPAVYACAAVGDGHAGCALDHIHIHGSGSGIKSGNRCGHGDGDVICGPHAVDNRLGGVIGIGGHGDTAAGACPGDGGFAYVSVQQAGNNRLALAGGNFRFGSQAQGGIEGGVANVDVLSLVVQAGAVVAGTAGQVVGIIIAAAFTVNAQGGNAGAGRDVIIVIGQHSGCVGAQVAQHLGDGAVAAQGNAAAAITAVAYGNAGASFSQTAAHGIIEVHGDGEA